LREPRERDLAGVSFMDSTALGAIVRAQRELHLAAGELVLVSADPPIMRLFAITGLDRVMRLHTSLMQAIDEPRTGGGALTLEQQEIGTDTGLLVPRTGIDAAQLTGSCRRHSSGTASSRARSSRGS
jgi:STAS domain